MTAAQSAGGGRPGPAASYRGMAGGVGLGLGACGVVLANPPVWPLVLPFALLWLGAPALAWRLSQPGTAAPAIVSPRDARELRLIARRTWRYFETFVTEASHHLPPDNFQEMPRPVVAQRTSPTNIGLYLLSTVVARDMGWIGQGETLRRLEETMATMQRMRRFRGHFFNWYDTADLRVLPRPMFPRSTAAISPGTCWPSRSPAGTGRRRCPGMFCTPALPMRWRWRARTGKARPSFWRGCRRRAPTRSRR